MSTIVLLPEMKIMSSGMRVFFIQKLWYPSSSNMKSMPLSESRCSLHMRPRVLSSPESAASTGSLTSPSLPNIFTEDGGLSDGLAHPAAINAIKISSNSNNLLFIRYVLQVHDAFFEILKYSRTRCVHPAFYEWKVVRVAAVHGVEHKHVEVLVLVPFFYLVDTFHPALD